MKNEELKNRLDDAVSGIGEDPWLLRKVISRAESMEDTPVKKKLAFGTVQVVLAIILLMSVGIASLSSLNNTDSLKDNETIPMTAPAFTGSAAETELASLKLDGVPVYDGKCLYFDWTVENKNLEVPMWYTVEKLSFNGIDQDIRDANPGEEWIPHPEYSTDGTAWHGWLSDLPDELIGAETIHVEIKVNTSRPVRPWKLLDTEDRFREELEKLIDEGYFVIPAYSYDDKLYPTGYFWPEENLTVCENGWAIAVSGGPLPDDTMGDIIVETLKISFDIAKPEPGQGLYTSLKPQESYENEYCTAVIEQADSTLTGLHLTIRVKPNEGREFAPRYWDLAWKDLTDEKDRTASLNPSKSHKTTSPDHEGEFIWELFWDNISADMLPDTVTLECRLADYELVRFPIQVR